MSKTSVSLDAKKEEKVEQPQAKKTSLKSLRDLIFLGRIEKMVECGDISFSLRSITAEDQRHMIAKLLKMPEDSRLLLSKVIALTFSVEKVNNVSLEDICEDEELTDKYDRRMSVIQNLQVSVVNKLYRAYEELLEESNSKIDIEDVKKS